MRERVTDTLFDAAQRAGVLFYAWRGENMARLMTPKVLADPYPAYDQMRSQGELLFSERFGIYTATTHELVSKLARDSQLSVDNRLVEGYGKVDHSEEAIQDHEMMLRMDDPDHARIRRLVGAAFSPRAISSWGPMVEKLANSLLDDVDAEGFDIVGEYAVPLTVRVICELMGVPADDWRSFRRWGSDATAAMGAMNSRANMRRSRDGMRALYDYFSDLIERRRRVPGDDLLSVMIAAEEEGDRLSDRELVANSILLLIAGFETTVNLIGNGTVALLSHREQWDRLKDEPAVSANAVEELLRFDSSVQFTSRNTREETEIAGRTVRKGAQLILLLGGANRDPAAFPDPGRLDLGRPNAREHVAFSSGTHHCLGANLARLEAQVAFSALAERFPDLRPAGRPKRRPTDLMRGFETVPVRR